MHLDRLPLPGFPASHLGARTDARARETLDISNDDRRECHEDSGNAATPVTDVVSGGFDEGGSCGKVTFGARDFASTGERGQSRGSDELDRSRGGVDFVREQQGPVATFALAELLGCELLSGDRRLAS